MDNAAVTAQAVRVAVIADDLTGAGDTVVQFAQKGWKSWLLRTGEVPQLPPVAAVARALIPGRFLMQRPASAPAKRRVRNWLPG